MSYVLDWYADCSHDISEPIYILDIGAGLGKLGYLIMFRLFEMKEFWPESSHPPFMYAILFIFYVDMYLVNYPTNMFTTGKRTP